MNIPTPNKLLALVLALAVTASACGGGETETNTAQAQIDALQAQLDELEGQADAPAEEAADSTTTTVVDEPEPDIVVEATTTTTVVEEVVEDAADAVDAVNETDADAPASADGYAVPTGYEFDASTTPDGLDELINDIAGPTDNAAGEFARVAPFPALSTLPDTIIEGADFWLGPGEVEISNTGWGIVAEFTTTAAPADAVLAYQAELAALIGGEATSGIIEDDDREIHWAEVGDYRVSAVEWRRLTSVAVTYSTLDGLPPEIGDKISGIRSELDLDDQALLKRFSLTSIGGGNHSLNAFYVLPGVSLEDTQAILDDALAAAGWVESDASFNITHDSPTLDGQLRVTADQFNEDQSIISVDYSYMG